MGNFHFQSCHNILTNLTFNYAHVDIDYVTLLLKYKQNGKIYVERNK